MAVGCPRLSSAAGLTLGWDPPTDGITTGYIVLYGTTSQSYSQQIDVGGATTYTVDGLTDGTTYYFAVRAYDAFGDLSAPSAEVSAVAPSVPSVVTTLALAASLPSPQMVGTTVTWLATATGGVAPYQYQWSLFSAGSWSVGAWTTASTWTWTPSVAGNDYQVRVAVRSSGSSSYTGELTQTVPFTITALPASPGAFTKSAPATGTTGVTLPPTLSWAASSGATSYEYCLDTSNNSSCDTTWTTTPTLTAAPSGLAPNTTYWWQVRARNAIGPTDANSGTWWSVTTAPASTPINVAAAARGATATASSVYSAGFAPSGAIDGDRAGLKWGTSGGWNDATWNKFGDWLQVDFAGSPTIAEIDVFTVQDAYTAPVAPTLTQTFTLYGLTDFQVQYWDGAQWLAVPGGIVTGNTHVWRQFSFAPLTTARIRVWISGAADGFSRVAEVEAYTAPASGPAPAAFSKTAPTTGTTGATVPPTLSWAASSGATSYEYCVDTTNNSSCDTTWAMTPTLTATPSGLAPNTTYWWQVRARNAAGATEANSGAWWSVATAPSSTPINVAAAAQGATATASSFYSAGYPPSGAIDGDRAGLNWGTGTGWNDATWNGFGDWLQVDFAGASTIAEIDVFTVQDAYTAPVAPTLTQTFTLYGLTDFQVQYWDGAQWLAVPGGIVTGSTHVWRQFSFAPLTTTRIRVWVSGALGGYARLTEVEAYTAPSSTPINVAAAAQGATATASSVYSAGYGPSGAIDGDRAGLNWNNGGGWNDATLNVFGDWLQVDFAGPQTINEVDVFTVQDAYAAPVTPTLTQTFTLYGLTDFQVQYWDGTQWLTVPGGAVTSNLQVWRQFTFAALTTPRIRVWVTGALGGYARVTEVEAYTTPTSGR